MTMTPTPIPARLGALALALLVLAWAPVGAVAQSGAAPAPADAPKAETAPPAAAPADAAKPNVREETKADAPPVTGPLAPLAWLAGCWKGEVNQREFREVWMPPRGNLMVGASHTTLPNRTIGFELIRLEPRADGVFYVATPGGQKEVPFKLTESKREGPDEFFLFTNAGNPFPDRILYRRGTGGWLYVELVGQSEGKPAKVVYPFRRIDCETGELIRR